MNDVIAWSINWLHQSNDKAHLICQEIILGGGCIGQGWLDKEEGNNQKLLLDNVDDINDVGDMDYVDDLTGVDDLTDMDDLTDVGDVDEDDLIVDARL